MANPTGRRLRISSKRPDSAVSWDVFLTDAETGEPIDGVTRIVLTIDAGQNLNEALVTYCEIEGGSVLCEDGEPVKFSTKAENVEIDDLTAFEIMDSIRKER
ncbi:MAG TPA: hypothetical protein VHV10_16405 [Ktedonobacteraceae bacterium]|jgi:hypothetical protein|nr:hypothetical protein [Ktedonobacteraceae bacterium]